MDGLVAVWTGRLDLEGFEDGVVGGAAVVTVGSVVELTGRDEGLDLIDGFDSVLVEDLAGSGREMDEGTLGWGFAVDDVLMGHWFHRRCG